MNNDLVTRIEQARAADEAWLFKDVGRVVFGFGSDAEEMRRFYQLLRCNAFLDAAVTLVPEGWRWIMREACPDKANPNEHGFFARLETRDFESVTWGKGSDWLTNVVSGQDVFCWAATPALALCAAALKARISMETDNE